MADADAGVSTAPSLAADDIASDRLRSALDILHAELLDRRFEADF